MADDLKGVTVYAYEGDNRIGRLHPEGIAILVKENGHLYVYGIEDATVAIYAPGNWLNAVVN